MSFQQLLPIVTVHAAFTEMLTLVMLVLIMEQSRQPFYIAVVRVLALLGYHQVYSWYFASFFTYSVHDYAIFFPTEYVYSQIWVLPLKVVEIDVGKSIPVKFRPSSVG